MHTSELIRFLEENELKYIEVMKEDKDGIVVRAVYEFDGVEVEAAEAYANAECSGKNRDEWNYDYFLPYLNEIAVDNVNDILDEYIEDNGGYYQFIAFDVPADNYKENDFIISLSVKEENMNLEDLLLETM